MSMRQPSWTGRAESGSSNVRPPTGRDTRGIPNTSSQMVMRVNDTTERGFDDSAGRRASTSPRHPPANGHESVASHTPPSSRFRPHALARPPRHTPGGTVLEPFAGSGTTAEGVRPSRDSSASPSRREAEYLPLIVSRLDKPVQLGLNFEEPALMTDPTTRTSA